MTRLQLAVGFYQFGGYFRTPAVGEVHLEMSDFSVVAHIIYLMLRVPTIDYFDGAFVPMFILCRRPWLCMVMEFLLVTS